MSNPIIPLDSAQGVFNASGVLEVFVSPPAVEYWDIVNTAVTTTDLVTSTVIPIAKLYMDSVADGNFVGGTYSGNLDSDDTPKHLERNQRLVCQWTGGTSGKVGTLTVFGTKVRY